MHIQIIVILLIIFLIFFISNDDKLNLYSQHKYFQYLFLIFIIFCMYNNINIYFIIVLLLIFIFFNSNIKDKILNNKTLSNKILNNNFINKFYKGSEIEKFIENFQSDYDVKPYITEEEYKKKNENELKEIHIEKQSEKQSEKQEKVNDIKYNNTENYENNKDVIEPFKLSVEEIKKLYENIKLEINKLD